jgi:hypothetical protein
MKYFDSIDLSVVLMGKFLFPWTWLSSYGKSLSVDLVVVLWRISAPMDLVVVLRRVLFFCYHRLDCLMDVYMYIFFAIDLIVVLWKFPFPWTWLLPYGGFLVSWTWLSSYERFPVPWTWLLSYGRFLFPWTWLSSSGKFWI